MRQAKVLFKNSFAGIISQDENGYHFKYDHEYLKNSGAMPISKTLPLKVAEYNSNTLFPFFDGLIPEGWLLDIAEKNWKLKQSDRMGLLMACCKECIGAVSIIPVLENEV